MQAEGYDGRKIGSAAKKEPIDQQKKRSTRG